MTKKMDEPRNIRISKRKKILISCLIISSFMVAIIILTHCLISWLNGETDYKTVKTISNLINSIVTLITGGLTFASILLQISGRNKFGWVAKTVIYCIMLVFVLLFGLSLFFTVNHRYTEVEIDNGSIKKEQTYFGCTKNKNPDGFGKLFDKDDKILYIGNFKNGLKNGQGSLYDRSPDGEPYLNLKGEFKDNYLTGQGKDWTYIAGEARLTYEGEFLNGAYNGYGKQVLYGYTGEAYAVYEGEFLNGKRNGNGTYIEYLDGEETRSYSGGWAYDKKYGYGIEREYGKEKEIYQGVYWDDKRFGDGVLEYYSEGNYIVWIGFMDYDQKSDDGAFYDSEGNTIYDESNHTLVYNAEYETWIQDEEEAERLKKRWPFPEQRMMDTLDDK